MNCVLRREWPPPGDAGTGFFLDLGGERKDVLFKSGENEDPSLSDRGGISLLLRKLFYLFADSLLRKREMKWRRNKLERKGKSRVDLKSGRKSDPRSSVLPV